MFALPGHVCVLHSLDSVRWLDLPHASCVNIVWNCKPFPQDALQELHPPTEYLLVPEWITIPLLIIEIHGCQTDFLRNKSDVNCYSISLVYPDKKFYTKIREKFKEVTFLQQQIGTIIFVLNTTSPLMILTIVKLY